MKNKKVDASTSSPVGYYDSIRSSLSFGQKNNIVIPPLPPSELESLWEAMEVDRGFSPSKRDKPFNLLTKEEQKKEIEEDLDALGKPYDTIIGEIKLQIKEKLLINHEKKFVIFDKVKDLHQKVRIYFKNGNSSPLLPNGLAENKIFEKIAKHHIEVLKYVSKDNPYYQGTRDLYSKYLTTKVLNEDYIDGRTIYKTSANIGVDIDTILAPHIKSSDDEALKELYERQYNTLNDLALKESDPLKNGHLDRKLCEEYSYYNFYQTSRDRLKKVLNKTIKDKDNVKNCFQESILKAYKSGYISDAHLVALIRYQNGGGYFIIGKEEWKLKLFLPTRKYFYVVYRDILRRLSILNKNKDYRFPNLGEMAGKKDSQGNIKLYRALGGNFYFDEFSQKGTYVESTSIDFWQIGSLTASPLYPKTMSAILLHISVPSNTQKVLDLRLISPSQSEILLTKDCPYKIDAIYVN